MKMWVTQKCGHEVRADVFAGSRPGFPGRDHWENRLCDECYAAKCAKDRADLDAVRAAESAQAAESARGMGLPPMRGTPKQVAWAETIRRGIIDRFDDRIRFIDEIAGQRARKGKPPSEDSGILRADFADLRRLLVRVSLASWWIDNKDRFSDNELVYGLKIWIQKLNQILGPEPVPAASAPVPAVPAAPAAASEVTS